MTVCKFTVVKVVLAWCIVSRVSRVQGAAPVFGSGTYTGTVNENSAADTTVSGITISATDPDGDAITYSIISSSGPFKLKSDGSKVLTNGVDIDYETTTSYTLTIQAAANSNTTTAVVTINILNVNEAPTFQHSTYTANINENSANGLDIITVPATDVDSGDTLNYTITGTGSSSFSVLSTGVIEVAGSLDFETKTTYTLSIKATDAGGLYDTATVIISINDVNENPVFSSAPYSADVVENNPAASVVTVSATDPDAGNSISYSLSGSGSSDFTIHSTSGVVTLNQALDYETRHSYSLTVAASDNKGGLVTTSLSINVTNSNDSPVSISSSYSASIDENVAIGTNVVQTSATDQDGNTITYSLSGSSNFSITSSGMIKTASALDFETTNSYSLTVSFSDGSTTVNKGVTVTVVNNNDAPTLPSSPYSASLSEGVVVGTSVYNVSGADADGDSLEYSISGAGATHFAINALTGEVKTSQGLDYEQTTSYSITVKVTDNKRGAASTTLTITITNTNDSPTFIGSPYTTTIDENLTSGTSLLKVSATDQDTSDTLTYSLSGTNNSHFSISSSSGLITTAQVLDYETVSSYLLTVSVSDGTSTTTAAITITVINKNDDPVFTNSPYVAEVDENSAGSAVYTVSATDADSNTLTFFMSGCGSEDFVLNPSTGVVTLARALNYEHISYYFLTVFVMDGSSSVSTNLNVTVNNTNDAPSFVNTPYTTKVMENSGTGSNVYRVTATDEDASDTLTYSMGGTNNGHFAIGSSTGVITTAQVLDYEAVSSYSLTVAVSDGTTSVSTPIAISVTDVNDAPVFTSAPYSTNVNENDASAAVYTVSATDQDTGPTDTLTFSLFGVGSALFSIHSTSGVISLTGALDYEQQPIYTLSVMVSDGKGSVTTTSVTVNVQNQNDAPVFKGTPYSASVSENLPSGSTVFKPVVQDDNTSDTLAYSLSGTNSSHFQISSSTGLIRTAQVLDYESLNTYTLTISVSDSTSTVTQPITITVGDVNDDPLLTNTPYLVSVTENNVNATVVTATAADADNDTLKYYLVGEGSGMFSMNYLTGLVTLTQALNYEAKSLYALTVLVFDDAGGSNATSLTVNVVNGNDAPVFLNTPYSVSISENTASGSRIAQTFATDQDTLDSLTYSLNGSSSNHFSISNVGIISTTQKVDYETVSSYSLTVSVSDGTVTTTAPLTVSINDLNDAPVFSDTQYNVTINENTTAATSVLQASATDQDGDNITFTLVDATSSDFSIHSSSGQIITTAAMDYEKIASYLLTIQADDGNGGKSLATVQITLVDLNDEIPKFGSAVYKGHVAENTVIGTSVLVVTATDKDSVDSSLTYSLAGSGSSQFSITSNGLIKTASAIDYESVQSYTLTLNATDNGGNTGTTTINIAVINVIDNTPVFGQGSYNGSVAEDSSPGTSVMQITATDQDNGDQILYSVSGPDSTIFTVNENTGVISTNVNLDRETKDSYTFTITATDSAAKTATASVIISINDVNDNSPVCNQRIYSAAILENVAIGSTVLTVLCTDLDINDNGKVSYNISSGDGGSFTLNSSTGVLSTSSALDLETTPSYTINILAYDGGTPSKQASTTALITIQGINEHTPSFIPNNTYELSLTEDITIGHDVITVTANDADAGVQGQVTYAILSGDTYGNFVIDKLSGRVEVRKSLDYETVSKIELSVTATDGDSSSPKVTTAKVIVNIVDVNDNYPQCSPTLLTPAVSESAAVGSTVVTLNCSDADSGVNGDLSFTITNGNSGGHFNISSAGAVTIATSLDYESFQKFSLTVTVTDNGVTTMSSQVSIEVAVSPTNEYSPVFTNNGSYTASVSEDTSVGSEVLRVTANDADKAGHAHSTVSYSIVSGNDGSFYIDKTTGAISLIKSLDRENSGSHTLTVQASDGTNTATATVVFTVSDVNDNYPVCSPTSYASTVGEDAAVGSSVVSVTCTDDDEGINKLLVYSITSGNTNTDFTINTNGTITTLRALDYETTPSYTLTVKSRDSSSPSNTQKHVTIEVSIAVMSVNEHTPVFTSSSYAHSIQENTAIGTSLLKVQATDNDNGPQGKISYSLLPLSAPFYIDTTSGIIRLKSTLDRESTASYSLTVTAHDNDPITADRKSANVTVALTITDVNDNDPLFSPKHYKVTMAENSVIGTNLTQVYCTDSDLSTNADLIYTIVEGDSGNYFNVSSSGLITTIKQLDYETLTSYSLTVQARDSSSPISSQLIGQAHLDVIISGINEYGPVFSQSNYSITISENTSVGTTVLDIDATDGDQGPQGQVSYSLSSTSQFFIDQKTGVIILNKNLDYESTTSYSLVVTAKDGDTVLPQSLTVNVTISIRDENDNKPTFNPTVYSVTIAENTTVGTTILSLTCADADSGINGQFNMAIISGNTNTGFSVSDAGVVTIATSLDMETTQTYSLVVKATDQNPISSLSSNAKVSITIEDVNEHAPTFTSGGSYTAIVSEDASIGFHVANVTATDNDLSTTYGSVTYTIVSGNSEEKFFIRPLDGKVFVKKSLDRELTPSYTLQIKASDQDPVSPKSSTATLLITLSDVNDNTPVCDPCIYSKSLSEDVAIGTMVTQVTCSDKDTSVNGIGTFTITSGNTTLFQVSSTGLVTTKGLLDYESVKSYILVITVADGGPVNLSSQVTISVEVTGINEFAPSFGQQIYNVSYLESITIGTTLVTVAATDQDHGNDGDITFFIHEGNEDLQFLIDSLSGKIELKRPLDRETKDFYNITVGARDHGSPNRTSYTTVSVTVLDVNDNAPNCSQTSFVIQVAENKAINSTIVELNCSDFDKDGNSDITYNITSGNTNSDISVNTTSGIVSLTNSLDQEKTVYYDLIILVSDKGIPQLNTQIKISIAVIPVNEFAPTFSNGSFYNVTLNEDVAVGTTIVKVSAHDSDSGSHGDVSYTIISGNDGRMFQLGEKTGEVLLKKTLDYELESFYSLTIRATDGAAGNLAKYSDAKVNITVIDRNDNPPSCVERYKVLTLLESTVTWTVIFKANCTDPDFGSNALLSYHIVQGNNDGVFNVTSSGDVTLISSLNSEHTTVYNLVVMVTDSGSPSLSCNITLTVDVQPVNEFQPRFVDGNTHHLDVLENITLGTVIFQAKVQDNDTGAHGSLTYSLVENTVKEKFYLDSVDGRLILTSLLDRETVDHYNLTIKVHDGAASVLNQKQANVTLYVNVVDVNDNSPICTPRLYTVEIPETIQVGSNITTIKCTDKDSGLNSQLTYTFDSGNTGNHFKFDNNTIVVASKLDHENVTEYSLIVNVADGGSPSHVTDVVVTVAVTAKNEHIPEFQNVSYFVNVSEWTAIGTNVFDVNATDDDKGIHGNLEYFITSGLNGGIDFTIDKQTGVVKVGAKLNRETRDVYILNITARDKGNSEAERLLKVVALTIGITDENDNPPVFTQDIFTSTVPENISTGDFVVKVTTTDADIGINAEHAFSITGGDGVGKFSIIETTGIISALSGLDYETKSTYYLSITARDKGVPQLHALAGVRIYLSDVNDNKPVFFPTVYITSISETTSAGSDVIPVHATDRDTGLNAEMTYSVVGGDSKDQFDIGSNGMIRTKGTLDCEDIEFYTLIIRASDKGSPSLSETVSVNITILDVNDNAPIFSSSAYSVALPEDAPVGTRFLNISATDADRDLNAKITYSIVSGNTGNKMAIDEDTGSLYSIGTFDREKVPSYQLTIKAQDTGNPPKYSTTNVQVMIIDRNDNTPSFTNSDYSFVVTENQNIGHLVGVVKATDIDNGTHAQLVYSIEPTLHSNHFTINPLGGTMYTALKLDREATALYKLKVKVSDSATYPNQLYNITTVSISVLDLNDNPPIFPKTIDSAAIAENSPSGTLVTRVTATDKDHGANARVSYSLSHAGVYENYFRIDGITGEIFVQSALDYEQRHDVMVTVTAKDDGYPSLNGSMKLTIDLIDVNDNAPVLGSNFYEAAIRSDRTFGPPAILTVNATDIDSDDNAKIIYEMDTQQEYFNIDPTTGAVTLKATPGSGKMFTFRVRAKDNGTTPLTSPYATVRIDTIDAEKTMVDITLDITQEEFEAKKEYFLKKLSAMLGADVKIADIQEINAETKRKRRETKKGIKITLYAVVKPTTNTTDPQTKANQVKKFLSRDEILAVLLDKNGNLNTELTNSTELKDFKITKVAATKPTVPPKPSFMEKIEGIVTVGLGTFAVIVILIAVLCIRSKLKKRKLREQLREPHLRPKKGVVDTDFQIYKPRIAHNKVMALPPSATNISTNYNARRFDGKAVDPVSGRVYAFNKVTGERMWLHQDKPSGTTLPRKNDVHRQRTHHNEATRPHYDSFVLPGTPQ